MTIEEQKQLIEIGRQDLVDAYLLCQTGYAGLNSKGTIVDRRIEKDATPIKENYMFNCPKPKNLDNNEI